MKIMKKIDWYGLLFFVNTIIMITTGIYNLNNLVSCYETINYHVWLCNQSISYWIFNDLDIEALLDKVKDVNNNDT